MRTAEFLDQIVTRGFPQPIAIAWARVVNRSSELDKTKQLEHFSEVLPRTVASLFLADHLVALGQPAFAELVEKHVPARPLSGGSWWKLVRRCVKAAQKQSHFIRETATWDGVELGERLTQWRNKSVHAGSHDSQRTGEQIARELLDSLSWLHRYTIFRVTTEGHTRSGTSGAVISYSGQLVEPTSSTWTWSDDLRLFTDEPYLAHPDHGILELHPFFGVGEGHELTLLYQRTADFGIELRGLNRTEKGHAFVVPQDDVRLGDERLVVTGPIKTGPLADRREIQDPRFPLGFSEVRKIGEGGWAEVYECNDLERRGERCAIKILSPARRGNPSANERLRREGAMVEGIRSPYIIDARLLRAENGSCVRMSLLTTDLARLHASENLSAGKVMSWATQLLQALEVVHDAGIVHRDIKPANLLLDHQETIKLSDFGIAKRQSEEGLTEAGVSLGTPGYAAPEQQFGEISPACDIYGAGVTLLQLLVPDRKVPGTAVDSLLTAARAKHGADPKALGFIRVLAEMVRTDASSRPTASQALQALRDTHSGSAPPQPTVTQEQEWFSAFRTPAVRRFIYEDRYAKTKWHWMELGRLQSIVAENWEGWTEATGLGSHWPHSSIARDMAQLGPSEGLDCLGNDAWRYWTRKAWPHRWVILDPDDFRAIPGFSEARFRASSYAEEISGTDWLPLNHVPLREVVRWFGAARRNAIDERALLAKLSPIEAEDALRKPLDELWATVLSRVRSPRFRPSATRKPDGSVRRLLLPEKGLHGYILKLLAGELVASVPGHPAATAFTQHRSTGLHARYHAGAREAVTIDIQSFFDAVYPRHLRDLFAGKKLHRDVSVWGAPFSGWSASGIKAIKSLTFAASREQPWQFLPQGAPTSPILANIAAYPMDVWIEQQMKDRGWTYSRYADDLVISTRSSEDGFLESAEAILRAGVARMGWKVAERKTRRWQARSSRPLVLTGLIVPDSRWAPITFPRELSRRLRAAKHRMAGAITRGDAPSQADHGLIAYAAGVSGDVRLMALASPKFAQMIRAYGIGRCRHDAAGEWFWRGFAFYDHWEEKRQP